jgi:S-adenosylmethionine synthetase
VRIHDLIRAGSQDLQMLFARRKRRDFALANDTSVRVDHAPLSPLERLVLAIEKRISGRDRVTDNPAWGEDIKVMGIRCHDRLQVTVSCAMIDRYLTNMDDYLGQKAALEKLVNGIAGEHGFAMCEVAVNAARS